MGLHHFAGFASSSDRRRVGVEGVLQLMEHHLQSRDRPLAEVIIVVLGWLTPLDVPEEGTLCLLLPPPKTEPLVELVGHPILRPAPDADVLLTPAGGIGVIFEVDEGLSCLPLPHVELAVLAGGVVHSPNLVYLVLK